MAPLWHELAGHYLKRRGMVIILSDFFDDIDALTKALRHLKHRKHEVLLFHVLAREEIEFPFNRLTQFRNLERRDDLQMVDARRLRQEYLHNFQHFCTNFASGQVICILTTICCARTSRSRLALGHYLSRRQR